MVLKAFREHFGRGYEVYEKSYREKSGFSFFLAKGEEGKLLIVAGEKAPEGLSFFKEHKIEDKRFFFCRKNHENLEVLKTYFSDLKPVPIGLKPSFGTGDRLGITTPAHVRALKDSGLFPVFAQQSVRENERTGRNWRDVLDDATWGVFQEGFSESFGADADHIKKEEDLIAAAREGFSMFTLDPSDHVRNLSRLDEKEKNAIFENILKKERLDKIYLGKKYTVVKEKVEFDEKNLRDAALVYYDAVVYVSMMYQILKDEISDFDLEVSVDETETPTSPLFHIFVVEELRRKKVEFTNLALRFIGEWEKGVDYKGDLALFEKEIKMHAEISRMFGGYKLSLHSGSDKFSVYPIFSAATDGLFHVKTAGTSYLEAIKTVSIVKPSLFREIFKCAVNHFEEDRKSYHISADLSKAPDIDEVKDEDLPKLFEDSNVRQILHVTYGSVLRDISLKKALFETLEQNEELFYEIVANHIKKHVTLLGGN
ncbi:tagaturonate epimerase family protein [Thermotoga sp. KOL6]|uniref:tagaturonate epimerase family protein n=1 Tax=Thermotoga sp. KOL6 TaxID=126741 RepID=UPI000C769EB1|nr:tagaturonate epimerase family protein [Thermotoga sp. KOL6]PLV59509.1 hypothetical protein AS005_05300 [Thermotoga sp. KOL6]